MQTARKPEATSNFFNPQQVADAKAAAAPDVPSRGVDWAKGVVTPGSGVAAMIAAFRRGRTNSEHQPAPRPRRASKADG